MYSAPRGSRQRKWYFIQVLSPDLYVHKTSDNPFQHHPNISQSSLQQKKVPGNHATNEKKQVVKIKGDVYKLETPLSFA